MSPAAGVIVGGLVGSVAASLPVVAYTASQINTEITDPSWQANDAARVMTHNAVIVLVCVVIGGYVGYRLTR